MQQTWQMLESNDQSWLKKLQESWHNFYSSLRKINEFKIQRNINPGNLAQKFDPAGFDDASKEHVYTLFQGMQKTINNHI